MKAVKVVAVVFLVFGGFVLLCWVGNRSEKAAASYAADPGNQTVVWDPKVADTPAHYLKSSNDNYFYTACGAALNRVTHDHGTISEMEKAKKAPCLDYIHALQRYIDSINIRPRNLQPDRSVK